MEQNPSSKFWVSESIELLHLARSLLNLLGFRVGHLALQPSSSIDNGRYRSQSDSISAMTMPAGYPTRQV